MQILEQGRRQEGGAREDLAPPIDMLGPPINKLTLLKTEAFVLNFKLRPPPDKLLVPTPKVLALALH